MTGSSYICHHNHHICYNNRHKPNQAKNLLLRFPALSILQSPQKEILERIGRACEAIINILIVRVRFEPQFVGIREEQQTENEEDEHKSKGRGGDHRHCEEAPLLLNARIADEFSRS